MLKCLHSLKKIVIMLIIISVISQALLCTDYGSCILA